MTVPPPTFEKCRPIFELKVTPYFQSQFHFNRARRAPTDDVTQSQTEAESMQMNLCNYLFTTKQHTDKRSTQNQPDTGSGRHFILVRCRSLGLSSI